MTDNTLTDIQFNILKYMPDILLIDFNKRGPSKATPPEIFSCPGLLLVVNIKEFAQLTLDLIKKYHDGIEIIAEVHKNFYALLQDYLGQTGCDFCKYSTDRFLLHWPIPSNSLSEHVPFIIKLIIYQILRLKDGIDAKFKPEGINLKVNFILTLGEFTVYQLGGLENRIEYLPGGTGLLQALEHQESNDEDFTLAVSNALYEKIHTDFQTEQVKYGPDQKPELTSFFYVRAVNKIPEQILHIDPLQLKKDITKLQYEAIKPKIWSYLPQSILPYISQGIEQWASEIRIVSSLCINIPVNFPELLSEPEIKRLNYCILQIQKVTQTYEGFIYRSYLDDKGLNVFVIYGHYNQAHQEDAARATLTGSLLLHEFNKQDIQASIGVASGHAIFTISGEFRKDLFIIGEPLYLSFYIMLVALKDPEKRILTDYETKLQAENKISFAQYKNPVYSGKISKGIYEPMFTVNLLQQTPYNPFPEIRTHHFNLDYSTMNDQEDYTNSVYILGMDNDLKARQNMILKFLKTPVKSHTLLIGGPCGSGKSLFARNLLESTADLVQNNYSSRDRPLMLASSLNPYQKLKRLNGWRNVMREILTIMSRQSGKTKEDILVNVLAHDNELQSNIPCVEEILDLQKADGSMLGVGGDGIKGEMEETFIASKEVDLPQYEQKIIASIMVRLLKRFLNENHGGVDYDSGPNFGEGDDLSRRGPPLILCLDDMQNHDEASWTVTLKVLKEVRKIFLIGVIRSEEIETTPQRATICDQGIRSIGSLQESVVDKCIMKRFEYQDVGKLVKRILEGIQPCDELTRFILETSEGVPSTAIDLIDKLLKQNMLQYLNNEVFPNDMLRKFMRLNQFIEISVPMSRNKVNGFKLDSLSFGQYSVLKIASAIGNTFDLKTLIVTNPFYHTILQPAQVLNFLNDLRNIDLIELIDDSTKNLTFRFTTPFIRESIYQRISFTLRRGLHRIIAESWQNAEDPLENEFVLYQWSLSDPDSDYQDNYQNSAKRAYIVKNINSILQQGKPGKGEVTLKSGKLDELNYIDRTEWNPVFAVLTPESLKEYKNESEYREKPVFEQATIPLKNIIFIQPIYRDDVVRAAERPGFKIGVTQWFKGPDDNGYREFRFACENNEEVEHWQIHIEYVRAQAIYEEFNSKVDPRTYGLSINGVSIPNTKKIVDTISDSPARGRIKEVGFAINNDMSVGQTLGYNSAREKSGSPSAMKREILARNHPSPSPIRDNYQTPRTSKELVQQFLSKGQQNLVNFLVSQPSNRGSRLGMNSDLPSMNNTMNGGRGDGGFGGGLSGFGGYNAKARRGSSPFREQDYEYDEFRGTAGTEQMLERPQGVNTLRMQPYIPNFPTHVRKTIDDKLKTFDQDHSPPSRIQESPYHEISTNRIQQTTPDKPYTSKFMSSHKKRQKAEINLSPVPYQKDSDEMIVTIVKPKKGKQLSANKPETNRSKTTNRIPNNLKKTVCRPNIYGRYEYFSTFFIDSYLDDRLIQSVNNELTNVQEKFKKRNEEKFVNPRMLMLRKDIRDGEHVFVYDEESYLRNKQDGVLLKDRKGRIEDEPPVYRPYQKDKYDLANETYRLTQKSQPNDLNATPPAFTGFNQFNPSTVGTTLNGLYNNSNTNPGTTRHTLHQHTASSTSTAQLGGNDWFTPLRGAGKGFDGYVNTNFGGNSTSTASFNPNQKLSFTSPNQVGGGASNGQFQAYNFTPLGKNNINNWVGQNTSTATTGMGIGLGVGINAGNTTGNNTAIKGQGGSTVAGIAGLLNTPNPNLTQNQNYFDQFSSPTQNTVSGGGTTTLNTNLNTKLTSVPTMQSQREFNMQQEVPKSGYMESNRHSHAVRSPLQTVNFTNPTKQEGQQQHHSGSTIHTVNEVASRVGPQSSNNYFGQTTTNQSNGNGMGNYLSFSPNLAGGDSYSKPVQFTEPMQFPKNAEPIVSMAQENQPYGTSKFGEKQQVEVQGAQTFIHPDKYFYLGHTLRPTRSRDGDEFTVDQGEFVVVTRVYEKRGLVEMLWKGLTGLFPKNDIEIIRRTDANEAKKHIMLRQSTPLESDNSANFKMIYSDNESEISEDQGARSTQGMGDITAGNSQVKRNLPPASAFQQRHEGQIFEVSGGQSTPDAHVSDTDNEAAYRGPVKNSNLTSKMAQRKQKKLEMGTAQSEESVLSNERGACCY